MIRHFDWPGLSSRSEDEDALYTLMECGRIADSSGFNNPSALRFFGLDYLVK
jgi:hypothetical protein